ncbi:TraI domain-containing protein, partial [Escherichia coli]|nr:TraI domain-containing protein [Escherichia coli]
ADEEIPRYPPFAKGLPMAPVDKVLQTQNELIQKIRSTLGFTQEEYDRLVMPVIGRYAAFVHLLPASEAHHHRGAGGLFRHGLEVAFWATQAS